MSRADVRVCQAHGSRPLFPIVGRVAEAAVHRFVSAVMDRLREKTSPP